VDSKKTILGVHLMNLASTAWCSCE